ncbi:MAG TPA: DUF6443 domain-containing protein [Cyclobacteriaceae bacterium]|jgi:RHS repeat-associated protein|nr:DUF6443 domain-containing protein [Cyclobacteriaceae bacterium]
MQRFIFITILFLSAYTVNAQITGPTSVTLGQSASYLVYEDIVYSPFNFTVVGGTVTASSRSGTNYNVTITWNFVGAGSLKFNQDGQTLAVTVTGTCAYMNPVTPTATFSVSTPVCGPSRTISYTGTPPAGYTWFWQTTSTGTATTNSTTSYTVSTSGTYYLRARSTCIDSWSPAVATPAVAVNPSPSIPPSVTNITACILSTFTLAGTVGANGNTLNWYTAATGGTPIAQGASVSYSDVDGDFAGSTTFYASSFNTTSGCESTNRKALTVTFKTITPAPTSLTGSSICVNGTGSATLTGVAGNGNTLRWYGASWYTTPGTPLLGSGASFSTPPLSATTTYYARAYNATTTCESYAMPVTATVHVIPNASATNQAIFSGQTTSIAVTNPNNVSGTVFNWTVAQTGISGGLSGSGATITQTLTTTAQANGTATYTITPTANGCSGTPSSVTATVYPTPIITAPQNFVVKGVPVTLDAGAGYDSYTWKNSALTTLGTARTFNAVLPDTYSVLVTKQGASTTVSYLIKANLGTVNQNYVTSNVALVDNITDASGMDNLPVDQVSQLIVYSDGLGRPSQRVTTQGSPLKNDIIQPIAYDEFGREAKQYLPYASSTGDGTYRTNAVYDQSVFYNPTTNGAYNGKVKTDADPYATIVFDSSPLNRPLQVGAPGTAWQPNVATPDNGKAVKSIRLTNVDGSTSAGQEQIKIWTLSPVTLNGKTEYLISSAANYASNTLMVKIIKDEENRQSREYYDKQGKLILKKVQYVDTNTGTGAPRTFVDDDWTLTYYLYDDLERLRFILQPKFIARNAVYAGLSTQQLQKNMLDSLAFEYRYDEKGRVIYKHDPGAQPLELVYDQWNRVILSQDGNQRNAATKKWSFVKYDALNRPIIQGEYASTNTRDNMVIAVNAVVNRYETTASGNSIGYTFNLTFPTAVSINDINNIIYYDDYSFKNNLGIGTAYDVQAVTGFIVNALSEIKTKVTGTKTRILGGTSWLVTAAYFDDHYRSLQVISDDHLGSKNITTKEYYGLTNWVTKKQVNHGAILTSLTEVKYDQGGRVTGVWQTMDNNPATKVLLASNNYNELGQLYEKNIHSSDNGTSFLQSNDYRYNIRGWLTSINNSSLTNDNISNDDANDLFGMELKYENTIALNGTNTTAKYDGNVSAMQWKTSNLVSATDEKVYGFKYDNLNRLTGTNYATKVGSSWTGNIDLYNENLTYDKNGNIRTLKRSSFYNSTNNVVVDDMAYYYKGNQLDAISDNAASSYKPYGFSEAMQGVTTGEYTYDYNGNMTVDQNKGLVGSSQSDPNGILYNSLGLPTEIRKGTSKVTYMYNAAGIKLRKIIYLNGTEVSRTDYVGDIVYENSQLQLVSTLEGRVVKNNGNWEYEYFHKDHLGNTRVVYGYKKQVDTYRATMETVKATSEENQFKNVAATRVSLYNHTLASQDIVAPVSSAETNGNIILSGSTPKAIGPAKMLQVSSGDRLQLEVYARYNTNVGSNTAVITTLASAVTGAYGLVNSGETASAFQALTNNVPTVASGITRTNTVAKAYLFYILFDNNYVYKQFGYQAITTAAAIGHERLYLDVTMPTDGYLYTYVANESNVSVASSVYFDDFSIIHNRSNSTLQVVQTNDYYPFGLQSVTWGRDNSIGNKLLNNGGSELNFTTGLTETFFRQYDPSTARFASVDPLAANYHNLNPYQFAFNNPLFWNDPTGAEGTPSNPGFNQELWEMILYAWKNTPEGENSYWTVNQSGQMVGAPITKVEVGDDNNLYVITGGFYHNDKGEAFELDDISAAYVIHVIPKAFLGEGGTGGWDKFLDGFLHGPESNEREVSGALNGLGLVADAGRLAIKTEARYVSSFAKLRGVAIASRSVRSAGQFVGYLGIAAVIAEGAIDRKVTVGDGAKLALAYVSVACPVFGIVYGLADITVQYATGTGITDRIANGLDEAIPEAKIEW